MALSEDQVIIIGAGPYGLAAAAHLRAAKVDTRVLGSPLQFWKNNMPAGMFLRSNWDASHISDPEARLTLDRYHEAHGTASERPIPLDRFIDYGLWFQQQVAPDLDQRQVVQIGRMNSRFRILLSDGAILRARRVVVAAGIAPFAYRPSTFAYLPPELASHSADHRDLSRFAGREVIVVGGGQSAIESAALLHEAGAQVEIVARASNIRWLHRRNLMRHPMNPLRNLFFPPTDVGPPGLNQIVARPDWFRRFPLGLQLRIAARSIPPAAAAWLRSRVEGIRIATERFINCAVPTGDRLHVWLSDGSARLVDHVLLATGYRVDVRRYSFLSPELLEHLRCTGGYPELARGLESSVPGLHFLGAPAAWSFGPLMRFVSGTGYTARALTSSVLRDETREARAQSRERAAAYKTGSQRGVEHG